MSYYYGTIAQNNVTFNELLLWYILKLLTIFNGLLVITMEM